MFFNNAAGNLWGYFSIIDLGLVLNHHLHNRFPGINTNVACLANDNIRQIFLFNQIEDGF